MPSTPPPLVGFNNNVRHRGRIFHIQTEDSGVKRPRIVTHLFADGGRIVRSTKTDYAEHIGHPEMGKVLRNVMKEQHKAMFIALRSGELDEIIEASCGAFPQPPKPAPSKRAGAAAAPDASTPADAARVGAAGDAAKAADAGEAADIGKTADIGKAAGAPDAVASPVSARHTPPLGSSAPSSSRRISNPNLKRVTPSTAPPSTGDLDLDVDALSVPKLPPREQQPDRAEPQNHAEPAASQSAPEPATERRPGRPEAPDVSPPPQPEPADDAGRYAGTRPAAIFGNAPAPEDHSIFGDNVISEKSLDEVILSYIAEDLEEPEP